MSLPSHADSIASPNVAEDEEQNAEAASLAAVKESLEPQASTKAVEKRQKIAARGGISLTNLVFNLPKGAVIAWLWRLSQAASEDTIQQ